MATQAYHNDPDWVSNRKQAARKIVSNEVERSVHGERANFTRLVLGCVEANWSLRLDGLHGALAVTLTGHHVPIHPGVKAAESVDTLRCKQLESCSAR